MNLILFNKVNKQKTSVIQIDQLYNYTCISQLIITCILTTSVIH